MTNPEAAIRPPVIAMETIRKVYDTGKVKVEALKGIDLAVGRRRVRRHRRAVGLGQVHADEPHRLPRHADRTASTGWRGEDVSGAHARQLADIRNRRVGFVFQNFNLLPQITAFENVEMPLLFGGVAAEEAQASATEELLDQGRPRRAHGAQADRALRRPDAARRDRPRPGHESRHRPRRRAHRQPRHELPAATSWASSPSSGSRARTLVVITHDMTLARRAGRVVEDPRRPHRQRQRGRGLGIFPPLLRPAPTGSRGSARRRTRPGSRNALPAPRGCRPASGAGPRRRAIRSRR